MLRVMHAYAVIWAAALVVSLATPSSAQVRTSAVTFPPGNPTVTLKDKIKGNETRDYTIAAKAGNALSVILTTSNRQAYFNVLPPGSEEAIFIGSTVGTRFKDILKQDGTYTVRVYLMRAAARRNETADVKLDIGLGEGDAPATADAKPTSIFDQKQELQGISFHVTSPNSAAGNTVTVAPSGLSATNQPETVSIDGIVTGAEAGDINVDGSPEIYVYVRGNKPGTAGSLVAFSTNAKKSMSRISLPELTAKQAKGHRGGDEFALVENAIARRFPIYGGADGGKPTGKMRQLQYKPKKGEASWVLKVDRVVEF